MRRWPRINPNSRGKNEVDIKCFKATRPEEDFFTTNQNVKREFLASALSRSTLWGESGGLISKFKGYLVLRLMFENKIT
jgi:hypothetical protein